MTTIVPVGSLLEITEHSEAFYNIKEVPQKLTLPKVADDGGRKETAINLKFLRISTTWRKFGLRLTSEARRLCHP